MYYHVASNMRGDLFSCYCCSADVLQKLERFHVTVTNIAKELSEREANDALQAYVR